MKTFELIKGVVERFNAGIGHDYVLTEKDLHYTITSNEPGRFSGVLLSDLAMTAELLWLSWRVGCENERIYVTMH